MPLSQAQIKDQLTAPGQQFEMEDIVVRGQNLRAWKNAPRTLREIFEASTQFADRDFIVYEDDRLTYGDHYNQVVALTHALVEDFGVQNGDRVAVAMRNYPEWSVAFWAAVCSGAIVVPVNAWLTGEELNYCLSDSGSTILICDQAREKSLEPHYASLGMKAVIVARAEEPLLPGHLDFAEVISAHAAQDSLPDVAIDTDDDATIFYTSGTTGNPKGALGTHRNICTSLLSLAYVGQQTTLRLGNEIPAPEDAPRRHSLLSVPLFHVTGSHSNLVPILFGGGKLVLMYRWQPEQALQLIETEEITGFGGVPAMVWQVLESPDLGKRDLSSILGIGYGGAPAASELVRRIQDSFPDAQPSNGYGMTETSGIATMNAGIDYVDNPDSVGTVLPVCDVIIADDDGNEVPRGEMGEIWMRGPNIIRGYWNKPEATAESITDGFMHSGDIGTMDEAGFVCVVDRAKDMLIRGGENIYCVEVENALFDHPDVIDAAVIGLPHMVLGEEVAAVVQLTDGSSASPQDLMNHAAGLIAKFKVPIEIDIRDEPLPRNANGKILKRDLRTELAARQTS
ncbi:MAG: class I adenylate-forming enzyme family protein, partial [Gammaproteobacteria bacterium]